MESFWLLLAFGIAFAVGLGAAFILRPRANSTDNAEMKGALNLLTQQQTTIASTITDRLSLQEKNLFAHMQQAISEVKMRLVAMDATQQNILKLEDHLRALQSVLDNKQLRGAYGESQLYDLLSATLAPSQYATQYDIPEGGRVDAAVFFHGEPSVVPIDAKFPLEAYRQLLEASDDASREAATRNLRDDVIRHIKDISQKYIHPPHTTEGAMMFIPSESVFAEIHKRLPEVVEKAHRARVWLVSPTTLMAVLYAVRSVVRHAEVAKDMARFAGELQGMIDDLAKESERLLALEKHFGHAQKALDDLKTMNRKIAARGESLVSKAASSD